jgi:hypothetical protein
MMQKFELKSSTTGQTNRFGPPPSIKMPSIKMPAMETSTMTPEEKSKDVFFVQLARLTEAMVAEHGKDFAMGTLILSARFIAEGKPLIKRDDDAKPGIKPTHTHSANCGCS